MKIVMLARNPNLYTHLRLVEAAEAMGREINVCGVDKNATPNKTTT